MLDGGLDQSSGTPQRIIPVIVLLILSVIAAVAVPMFLAPGIGISTVIALSIISPITGVIAWRLTSLERDLHEREIRSAEVNHEIEIMLNSVDEVNREIEIMLDNLDQGIFTFNLDGTINPEHSLRAEQLFGVKDFGDSTLQEILSADDKTVAILEQWISMIAKSRFLTEWGRYERLNPLREITTERDGKPQILTVSYRPIVQEGRLQRIMVLATDITAQREAQRALERATLDRDAEVGRLLAFVQHDASALGSFLAEAEHCLARAREVDSAGRLHTDDELARDIHTLKGNAGSFGLSELGNIADGIEDAMKAARRDGETGGEEEWQRLTDAMQEEFQKIADVRTRLFSGGQDRMSIDRPAYDGLLAEMRSGTLVEPEEIYRRVHQLDTQPFRVYCEKYQRIIEQYRERRRVPIADLEIHTPDRPIHRALRTAFDGCILHLIRNAVDHGRPGRQDGTDHPPGVISIGFEMSADTATVTVSDNGAGIDPEAIADRALAQHIVTERELQSLSPREKMDLVFRPGFTTKAESTDMSGRGVGMDAVKTYIERLGGQVALDSLAGQGLTVTLTLPHTADPVAPTTAPPKK